MAYVKLTDGTGKYLPADKALLIWQVLNNEVEATDEQRKFCMKIDKVYLNRHKAPQNYIEAHWDVLKSMP